MALAVGAQSRAGTLLLIPALGATIAIALNPKGTTRLFAFALSAIAAVVATGPLFVLGLDCSLANVVLADGAKHSAFHVQTSVKQPARP